MLKTLIQYQMYIIIGILVFPIFAFIIYFIKNLIDRAMFVRTLHDMKQPLMERINNIEAIYEIKEEKEDMNAIINEIKNDINLLKKEIDISQAALEIEKISQIEKEITIFYENMKNPEKIEEKQSLSEEIKIVQKMPQQIYENTTLQQQIYQQENELHKEQIKVMNANITKFLTVYKEKDRTIDEKNNAIDEKNKSIYVLQQKLNEAEHRLKKFMAEHENDKRKDGIIEEKRREIIGLQQRLQEIEDKFRKLILLHKNITEKEQIKDTMIEEKNRFISNLEHKLYTIEKKIQSMTSINGYNKENILNKKIIDIDEKIQAEKRKNQTSIILFILLSLACI